MRQQPYRTRLNIKTINNIRWRITNLREANEHVTESYTLYFVELKSIISRTLTDNEIATNEKRIKNEQLYAN